MRDIGMAGAMATSRSSGLGWHGELVTFHPAPPADRSKGQCLFVMPKGPNWATITQAIG